MNHDHLKILYEVIGPQINSHQQNEKANLKTIEFDWDCGGWSNVILGVEMMICLAHMFNRALVIPKASKWYLLDGKTHLFDFYDEASFRSFVPSAARAHEGPRWTAEGKLIKERGKIDINEIEKHQDASSWHFPSTTRMLSYFSRAFSSPEQFYPIIRSALRIRADLIDMASAKLKENDLTLGEFIALHVRRNDFQYKPVVNRSNEDIVNFVVDQVKKPLPVLILSDVFDSDLIQQFKSKGHRVICWSQKETDGEKFKSKSKTFVATSSKESIVVDMICAATARIFFGSPLSTFSSRICHWRGLLSRKVSSIDESVCYTMPWHSDPMYWNAVDPAYWKSSS